MIKTTNAQIAAVQESLNKVFEAEGYFFKVPLHMIAEKWAVIGQLESEGFDVVVGEYMEWGYVTLVKFADDNNIDLITQFIDSPTHLFEDVEQLLKPPTVVKP